MFRRGLLALLIVYLPNALHFPLETGIPGLNPSNVLFLIAVLVMTLAGRDHAYPKSSQAALASAFVGWFVALSIGFAIALLMMPMDFMADFTYWKNALFYPLFYFVFRNCREDIKGTRQLIILVLVVAVIAGLEAVREGLDYGITSYAETRRASGPFGVDYRNANRAGVFYAMFLPMFVALALFLKKQRLWRIAAIISCGILAMAIMVTFSRQSYLIGILGLCVLLLRRNILIALLTSAVMFSSLSLLPDSVTQRVEETEQSTAAGGEELDASTASRFEIWGGAAQMWVEHPLGVGINRFKLHIGDYSNYAGYDAHNFYVLTVAELGPLGLFALLWVFWGLWRLAAKFRHQAAISRSPEAIALSLGFSVTVIAMALSNVYGSPFLEGAVMGNVWILCGLLERYSALTATNGGMHFPGKSNLPDHVGKRFPLAAQVLPGRYRLDETERSHTNS
ncbi:MAG: O-antigen ligase family protein [Xanthomonadaceae bacterium]|nr:O-antigen ligase family protein [Xanthomonadaceae bacterium]